MAGNTFGTVFKVTTFGESHGLALGVIIDGCPAGLSFDRAKIQAALDRRRPGGVINGIKSSATTMRSESDTVEILSGVFEGKTEGTPIAMEIKNTSQHSSDYKNLEHTFRPGHADFTYNEKYGVRDYRGGGRASGRETAARVAAGAVAKMILDEHGISVVAYTLKAAGVQCGKIDFSEIEKNSMRAPDSHAALEMESAIENVRKGGDSAGGIVECVVKNTPAGLGEPIFDKLDAELAKAMLSIGAIKGVEFGSGFSAADSMGSTNNDAMHAENGNAFFDTNNAGGILGGISNGNDIVFRVAVKPVPSIFISQKTVSKVCGRINRENGDTEGNVKESNEHYEINEGEATYNEGDPTSPFKEAGESTKMAQGDTFESTDLHIKGRHDVCLCPRIVPVVEAMTQIVLADMLLRNRCAKI